MIMKIAFVEAPSPWLVRQHAQVPLGPLYLATILKKHNYDVRFYRPNSIEEMSKLSEYDVIAFSGTTLEFPMVELCAKYVREHFKNTKIWYGGPHASATISELANNPLYDSIGIGEGESYIVQMAKDTKEDLLRKIYWPIGTVDLNRIPYPDRSLIEGSHGGDIFAFGENFNGSGNENVITARGCPYDCAFCSSKTMWHKKVRFRSPQNVLDEIQEIVDKWGIKQIRFCDDHLASDKNRAIELCEGLAKIGVSWRCSIRADILTNELCEAMLAGGCKEISPGIESGDQRVLDFLNKNTKLEKIIEGCSVATKTGLHVRGLFMIGTPGERPDTPEINMEFIKNLDYHSLTLSTFVPLPGTAIWLNPQKYDCDILSKNFHEYNKDFWVINDDGEKGKREYTPLIKNHFLTLEQQKNNIERMEQYILESNKCNKG